MTLACLEDWRIRCLAVAIRLQVAGRPLEAAKWRAEADRYNTLLQQQIPVSGGAA